MNRRHFLIWMGSIGAAAAAGSLFGEPVAAPLNAATLPPRRARPISPPVPAKPAAKPLALVYDRDYLLYEGPRVGTFGESPTRLQAIVERLTGKGLALETYPVREATFQELSRAHSPNYIRYIQKATYLPQDEVALMRRVERRLVNRPMLASRAHGDAARAGANVTGPAGIMPKVMPRFVSMVRYVPAPAEAPRFSRAKPYRAASLAAGGAIKAVEEVMSGRARYSFALIRPPGHHARRSRNMGFCIFNNAAVAARHAQKTYGAERVLIVDWDVHHGNGTQEIFYDDPSVLYFSTHQEGIYPKRTGKVAETGTRRGQGYNVNVPLPPYTGDDGFLNVYKEVLVPIARSFKPDLILVSAGQDAHQADFIAKMRMTDVGFAKLTRMMRGLAAELCNDRLVFVLEGGYNPKVAAKSVETICAVLNEATPVDLNWATAATPMLRYRIAQVKAVHQGHWPSLARSGGQA